MFHDVDSPRLFRNAAPTREAHSSPLCRQIARATPSLPRPSYFAPMESRRRGPSWAMLSRRNGIGPRPDFLARSMEAVETSRSDCRAHVCHQALIVGKVDGSERDCAKHLARLEQMMKVCPRIVAGGSAVAFRIDGARIICMTGILEVQRPEAREGEPVAAIAGRQHAVEHVDAARHCFDQVRRGADAHEIARAL